METEKGVNIEYLYYVEKDSSSRLLKPSISINLHSISIAILRHFPIHTSLHIFIRISINISIRTSIRISNRILIRTPITLRFITVIITLRKIAIGDIPIRNLVTCPRE